MSDDPACVARAGVVPEDWSSTPASYYSDAGGRGVIAASNMYGGEVCYSG